ncbi:MAG: hypothetical protein QME75_13980 [Deltaproteobacteria bacterium]|nr:hypothetical protein [Deltaproteobacteria bacterium]
MVEISGIPPYLAGRLPEPEQQIDKGRNSGQSAGGAPVSEQAGKARVQLVRAQNLLSPALENADLKKAAVLLRQVTHQFATMERQEMRQLYQVDRLRDLCCRLQGGTET